VVATGREHALKGEHALGWEQVLRDFGAPSQSAVASKMCEPTQNKNPNRRVSGELFLSPPPEAIAGDALIT
jgi:hypothetical protein